MNKCSGILVGIAALATGAIGLAPALGTTAAACPLPTFGPGSTYQPPINPAGFTPNVTNRLFPLRPGRTLVYTGTKDGKKALNLVTTTKRTRRIDGVTTRVVEDRLYLNNVLEERTSDYYAQDRCGNVWYFGEDTATLDANGRVVSRDGSFRAGVNGAQPGVYLQAHPQIGRLFRQEWSPGNAEDQFRALSTHASITVPFGTFHNALRTQETTALEPAVVDNKFYVKGLGQVEEVAVRGPVEKLVLIDVLS